MPDLKMHHIDFEHLPELLQAACNVVNEEPNSIRSDEYFWKAMFELKQALLKAGCVDE